MNCSHLFGPVQSRRLGVSLGVDMVPAKICSLNCVYCECGATTSLTVERKEYVSSEALIAELDAYLGKTPSLDYITFGGSGEPTLNTGIGRVARYLKKHYPRYRRALLTNGTLFHLPEVRKECADFDVVLPNLDAVSETVLFKINRPHPSLDSGVIIKGLSVFRKWYKGGVWLEIFIVPGINDAPAELNALADASRAIKPDRVQLNTLDRPGTCEWVRPATSEELQRIAGIFAPLQVEIITRISRSSLFQEKISVTPESLCSLVSRRPSTVDEIAGMTGLSLSKVAEALSSLTASGFLTTYTVGSRTFYRTSNQ
jgi:wyosine [tRNA(Phe)-imidazoG37] synthetase (radical SAM superfamily)